MLVKFDSVLRRKFTMFQTAPYQEGDGDGGEGGGGEGGEGGGEGGGGGSGKGWDGKFTPEQQAKVDEIVNKRFAKDKKEKEALTAKLKMLEQSAGLTKEERDNLQQQIEQLETSMLTKDEQTAREKKNLEEKYSRELKTSKDETETWRNRYTNSTLERALSDAAISEKAESPGQIRMMFMGGSYLSEDKGDDGKPTGTFTPRLKFVGLEGEGDNVKQVELDLPINDAIKKIKRDGLHNNLFKHEANGGTGKPPGAPGAGGNGDAMPTLEQYGGDHEKFSVAYGVWRSKNRQAQGV